MKTYAALGQVSKRLRRGANGSNCHGKADGELHFESDGTVTGD
jgi:hypothetical protein